jgi:adenylate kinase
VTALVALDVPDEELVGRLLNRGKSSGRADDNDEAIIRNRISVYKAETAQVFDYYAEQGKSKLIPGVGSVDEIFERLVAAIEEAC